MQVPASAFSGRLLRTATSFWFLIAVAGQWAFVAFIAGFYGPPTLAGDFAAWDKNSFLTHGYVAGDMAGNLAFGAHVILAAIITLGGTLQLFPQIRARAIWLHRWNGRLFIVAAFVISLSGLFLNVIRSSSGLFDHAAISLNAVLIMLFAAQTLRFVRAGAIDRHRRWALRTFMVVNGVWFLRVGMMGWMLVKVGLLGAPATFDAAFYAFWSFGSYLVPLAVLELWFLVQSRGNGAGKAVFGAALLVLALVMGGGIVGAALMIYWPLLASA